MGISDLHARASLPDAMSELHRMTATLDRVLLEVINQPYWRVFSSRSADSTLVKGMLREVMFETAAIEETLNAAVIMSIGRSRSSPADAGLIESMTAMQFEEVGRGHLAFEDYMTLGGCRDLATDDRLASPDLIDLFQNNDLTRVFSPLFYLGGIYFFRTFSSLLAELTRPVIERAGVAPDSLHCLRLANEEFAEHREKLAELVARCCMRSESAKAAVVSGFDRFCGIYPHPIWQQAMDRATVALGLSGGDRPAPQSTG